MIIKKIKSNKNKNLKLYELLINIFLVLFIIFPMLTIFDKTTYFTFSAILIFVIIYFTNWKNINLLKSKKTIYVVTIITFLIRIIYVFQINNNLNQISDFGKIFSTAQSLQFDTFYYQIAYHYFTYTFLNGMLYKLFGSYQIVTLIFNCILVSFIPILLYNICNKITKNNIIANICAIIYCCWPSLIIYTAIMSPDHVTLLLILIATYAILTLLNNLEIHNIKRDVCFVIIAGIAISLIGFFKNFSLVLLIALLIILFLKCLQKKQLIKKSIIIFVGIVLSFLITNTLMFTFIEHQIGAKVLHNQVGQYMYIGLGYPNHGFYDASRYDEYYTLLKENDMDTKQTNKYMLGKLWEEIKDNYGGYYNWSQIKQKEIFVDDVGQINWVLASIDNTNISNIINDFIKPINGIYYIIVMLFTLIGSIYNIRKLKNNNLLYINIVIFGSFLLLMIAEGQNRYKYSILPLICILSAYGIYYGYDLIKDIITKRKEK